MDSSPLSPVIADFVLQKSERNAFMLFDDILFIDMLCAA